jgi:hypothetical protein
LECLEKLPPLRLETATTERSGFFLNPTSPQVADASVIAGLSWIGTFSVTPLAKQRIAGTRRARLPSEGNGSLNRCL